jgi:hypothetical protein
MVCRKQRMIRIIRHRICINAAYLFEGRCVFRNPMYMPYIDAVYVQNDMLCGNLPSTRLALNDALAVDPKLGSRSSPW